MRLPAVPAAIQQSVVRCHYKALSSVKDAASLQAAQAGIQTVMLEYNKALAQVQGASLTRDHRAAVAAQQQQVSAQLARVQNLPGSIQATRKKLPGQD